jgi:hypothetical protein
MEQCSADKRYRDFMRNGIRNNLCGKMNIKCVTGMHACSLVVERTSKK